MDAPGGRRFVAGARRFFGEIPIIYKHLRNFSCAPGAAPENTSAIVIRSTAMNSSTLVIALSVLFLIAGAALAFLLWNSARAEKKRREASERDFANQPWADVDGRANR